MCLWCETRALWQKHRQWRKEADCTDRVMRPTTEEAQRGARPCISLLSQTIGVRDHTSASCHL